METVRPELVEGEKYISQGVAVFHHGSTSSPRTETCLRPILIYYKGKIMLNMTSREFNQATAKAIKASKHAPVIVTNRGTPACVLLNYDEYQTLLKQIKPQPSMAELLGGEGELADEFLQFEKANIGFKPAEFG